MMLLELADLRIFNHEKQFNEINIMGKFCPRLAVIIWSRLLACLSAFGEGGLSICIIAREYSRSREMVKGLIVLIRRL